MMDVERESIMLNPSVGLKDGKKEENLIDIGGQDSNRV